MKTILEQVSLSFQCPMSWEAMAGDEQKRHCGKCAKSVTDLSALTTAEAEAFLAKNSDACIRIWRDAEGQILTKGCGSAVVNGRKVVRAATTVALVSGALSLASCSAKSHAVPTMGVPCAHPVGE